MEYTQNKKQCTLIYSQSMDEVTLEDLFHIFIVQAMEERSMQWNLNEGMAHQSDYILIHSLMVYGHASWSQNRNNRVVG